MAGKTGRNKPNLSASKAAKAPFEQIRKRDGTVVQFDQEKIANAIYKAAVAVGGRDRELSRRLAARVVEVLAKEAKAGEAPHIEKVQDVVERVLIEEGYAKTAKAYILYRQQRAEVRKEKQQVLEKEEIDEVDKRFDVNALRVLKARYLRKDESGKLVETPKQLFTRVAVHGALPTILYDKRIYDINKKQNAHPKEEFDAAGAHEKYVIGKYRLNQYHMDALKRMYDRFNGWKQMRVKWSEFLRMLGGGGLDQYEQEVDAFYNLMVRKNFMPNTPAIANFGNVLGMGSACFVIDVPDSIDKIMDSLKNTAIIFKAGGGMGYNFSQLRPEGDFVSTTSGMASGPISFMRLFDTMTEVIKQGGIRRGANMGILNSNHPDIEKFITAKEGNKALRNFNISVLLMPEFWHYYESNKPYPLLNPRTGQVVRYVDARALFDMIVYHAWESAEPGVIFYDHVNKYNPFMKSLGPIVTTNPCAEVLLYPYESCNLGSINVWAFAREDDEGGASVDWEGMAQAVRASTRFLDNVIDVNKYPLKEFEEMTLSTRKIGLGMMGLADLLFELKLPYNSEKGRAFMEQLMEFVNYHSKLESIELAKERGLMPYYDKSFYPEGRLPCAGCEERKDWRFDWDGVRALIKRHGMRNGFTTVIAPTGSISMIAGCSSGIEPAYTLVFEKHVKVGSFYYVNEVFEKAMKSLDLYDSRLMEDVVQNGGTAQRINYIPPEYKKVFVTAMDIRPEDHIRALAAFQKWTDSSISKTNNFPASATVEDMRESYMLAYKLGCKDVTVFRDTSIKEQVLRAPKKKGEEAVAMPGPAPSGALAPAVAPSQPAQAPASMAMQSRAGLEMPAVVQPITAASAPLGMMGKQEELAFCPECHMKLVKKEGCLECQSCGWGLCK